MNWRTAALVLGWEFRRRVLSRGFWITTLLLPVLPLGMVALVLLLMVVSRSETAHTWDGIALYDATASLAEAYLPKGLRFSADSTNWHAWQEELRQGRLRWLIVVTDSTFSHRRLSLYGLQGSFPQALRRELEQRLLRHYAASRGVDSLTVELLSEGFRWQTRLLSAPRQNLGAGIGAATVVVILLVALLSGYGSLLTESILEEKTDRIAELVVGPVRPIELLLGKIAGTWAIGTFQLLCWSVLLGGASLVLSAPFLLTSLENAAAPAGDGSKLTEVLQFAGATTTEFLRAAFWLVIPCFVLGYLLYAGLFTIVGAAVTHRDQVSIPQFILLLPVVLPAAFLGPLLEFPEGTLSRILTLFPFTAPIILPFRALVGGLAWWEAGIAVGSVLTLAAALLWLAGKLYRLGMLHYGGVNWKLFRLWLRQLG